MKIEDSTLCKPWLFCSTLKIESAFYQQTKNNNKSIYMDSSGIRTIAVDIGSENSKGKSNSAWVSDDHFYGISLESLLKKTVVDLRQKSGQIVKLHF